MLAYLDGHINHQQLLNDRNDRQQRAMHRLPGGK